MTRHDELVSTCRVETLATGSLRRRLAAVDEVPPKMKFLATPLPILFDVIYLEVTECVIGCCSLTQVMRKFARQLDDWLNTALDDMPTPLQQTKIDRQYTHSIQLSLSLSLSLSLFLCPASQ